MSQSDPNSKYLLAASLLEQRLPTMKMHEQGVIRDFIKGLRSPDPKAWGRANANLAHDIASILNIGV